MHTLDRQREQLAMAGIAGSAAPDLSWLLSAGPVLPQPYALLVPGAAPHRPAKRWPAESFGALAQVLDRRGLRPVVAGAAADRPLAASILAACPAALDLTGRTSLPDLAGLAARAALAVGNDTGPMHLAAAVGCRCVVLFSGSSDPALTAPRGRVAVLRQADLADLPVDRVAAALG
jgi:ADP-heptose:LPS heptosyltransferase